MGRRLQRSIVPDRAGDDGAHPHFVRVSALRAMIGFFNPKQVYVRKPANVCGNGGVIHFALYGEAHPKNVRVTASAYIGSEEPLSWSAPAVR
jgi:hypothetical protein